MDTIAALNFGLVIATTIRSLGVKEKKGVMKYTVMTGIFAGTILACVYLSLAYMGMSSSGVFPIQEMVHGHSAALFTNCLVIPAQFYWQQSSH